MRTAAFAVTVGKRVRFTGTRFAAFVIAADFATDDGVGSEIGLAGFVRLRVKIFIAVTVNIFGYAAGRT